MAGKLRRVLGIGLAWGLMWAAAAMILGVIIGIVDPDSIGPGEGPIGIGAIIGPMGLFSGVAFALLLSIGADRRVRPGVSLARAVGCGVLGSAIVQLAYLGHGDAGLIANIKMALAFCAFGGGVAMAWHVMARKGSRGRSSLLSSS